jgi:UDP-N-acetylmuramate dehydrogenase
LKTTSIAALKESIRGQIRCDEPLAAYTTYRIGGPAAVLVLPASVDDVLAAVNVARETKTPWLALGLGSNVLVSDDGFDGVVIRVGKGMDEITQGIGGESWLWRVGAGLPTPQLARRSAKAGLAGVHRLVGVPGSVGGGVFMNAGAHGQDFATVVRSVELVGADGSVGSIPSSEIPWRYRSSGLNPCVVTSATIALEPSDPAGLDQDIRKHLAWRKAGTPFTEPCCGSVFRNPKTLSGDQPSGTAGQLIDALGLKGFRVGGAQVSTLHANYIVNTGSATAGDVMAVIEEVRKRVMVEYGIELELEVQILGEP